MNVSPEFLFQVQAQCLRITGNGHTIRCDGGACVYSNGATKETFRYIWEGLFNAVKTATGKEIKFKVFDDSGSIQCVILDMEAAQVQGLAITQMKMNDHSISQITEDDPDILVQYLIKLCYVH